jgi:hypothetical protein
MPPKIILVLMPRSNKHGRKRSYTEKSDDLHDAVLQSYISMTVYGMYTVKKRSYADSIFINLSVLLCWLRTLRKSERSFNCFSKSFTWESWSHENRSFYIIAEKNTMFFSGKMVLILDIVFLWKRKKINPVIYRQYS